MKTTAPGEYRVRRLGSGAHALVEAVCPFCQFARKEEVERWRVTPVRQFLSLQCPRCDIRENYGPHG